MISGAEIANRVDIFLKATPKKTATELGELLGTDSHVSAQAKRKRYTMLLRRLEEDRILGELKVVAEYLDVPVGVLLGVKISE